MKLLIDIGNTRLKWALVNGNEWLESGAMRIECAAELTSEISNFSEVQQAWVSNVAGEKIARQILALGIRRTHFISAQNLQCGVVNGYSDFTQLGSDRWASLIAAWNLTHAKCLVVNSGTATTIDTITAEGEFIGGLILPGLELMLRSLTEATHQLNVSQGQYVPLPLNTADGMLSGAIQAICGAVERQKAYFSDDVPVILGGGAAGTLEPQLGSLTRKVDDLVLRGLLLISKEMEAINK